MDRRGRKTFGIGWSGLTGCSARGVQGCRVLRVLRHLLLRIPRDQVVC